MSQPLMERYDDRIAGVLSCYDRVVITGTLPVVCYAAGMTGYLNANGIGIFDYPAFAKTLRDRVRERAALLAAEAGVTIEHVGKAHIRKEDVVARVVSERGDRPGLVHIISAMEACDAYKPWHDKQTHKTFIRPDSGKCLHYYFYFQDAKFGLVYLRVPTWAPFRLQFYCNGHSWLAHKLTAQGIDYTMADNAFVRIADWGRAQQLADALSPDQLHRTLDRYAVLCCPVSEVFRQSYHWSLMQVEYATDLTFRSTTTLGPLYEQLVRQSVLSVKAEQVAMFLGRQIRRCWRRRSARSSPPGSKARASSTASASARSRCTTSTASRCAARPRATTCRSSSTSARWNIGKGHRPGNSHRSRSRSTAWSTCGSFCLAATGAISPTSLRSMTSPPGFGRSTV
jgi:hypothetical protein